MYNKHKHHITNNTRMYLSETTAIDRARTLNIAIKQVHMYLEILLGII